MLFFQKKLIILNPLEQFEISTIFWYFSDFFTQFMFLNNALTNNFLFFKQQVIYNNLSNFDNLIYFISVCKNYWIWSFNFIYFDFSVFKTQVFFFNLLPTSDFFFIYQFLLGLLFFIFYQNNFFLQVIKFAIKFIIFFILNFLLNTIKNLNQNLIKYSPYLIALFIIILLLNILGLIPFVKSLTSTLSITFFLSLSSFLALNIEGLLIHNFHFFDKFAPASVPFIILPGLVIIELISYFMRPISLAIRLFANMLAGHILIKLFITFCLDLSGFSLILFFGCFFFICILMTLEVFISFLQAYIFMFLVLLYLDDVINNSTH